MVTTAATQPPPPRSQGPCELEVAQQPQKAKGAYALRCTAQGNYEPIQCPATMICYCVDVRTGRELNGTRHEDGSLPESCQEVCSS